MEGDASLCMVHLHLWFLSKPGQTAKRLYGIASSEEPAKRKIQVAALMKLFLSSQEEWTVSEHCPI